MKTICIIMIAMIIFGFCGRRASAEQASGTDKDLSETRRDISIPQPYSGDASKTQSDKGETERRATPRQFIDVFYGTVTTADTGVSASSQDFCLIFCGPPGSYSRQAHFGTSSAFGVRIGKWLEDYPSIGIAGDFSYLRADAPGVSIGYVPISFAALARYQLLRDDSIPEGRLQLYGGLMLSWVIGDIEVNGVGGSSSDLGYGALLGIAWHFQSVAVFGEYRTAHASLSYDSSNDWISLGASSASADLDTKQVVWGVSFKY